LEHWALLQSLSYLLAEFSRPCIHTFDVWGCVTLGGEQRRAEGGLQDQLLLCAFYRVREHPEHL